MKSNRIILKFKNIEMPTADNYLCRLSKKSEAAKVYRALKEDKNAWRELRVKLLKKQQFKCAYCLCNLEGKRMNVEHIIPIRRGGTNRLRNLVASCRQCNKDKRNDMLDEQRLQKLDKNISKLKKRRRPTYR